MLLTLLILPLAAPMQDGPWIARDGETNYRIVVPQEAHPAERYAAEELQRCLREMTGATLPIVTDWAALHPREILVGRSARPASIALPELGPDGYWLKTDGERLLIVGSSPRGTLYGVYGWLTDHLGARWFTPDLEQLPAIPELRLPRLDETVTPVFEYREPYLFEAFDADWQPRLRIHGKGVDLPAERGGSLRFGEGFFCHTFERLVPVNRYFDSHPEYFSLVGGERRREHPQLCCTNEEVILLCTEGILAAIEREPEATVFSVSQNDWAHDCECGPCRELVEREGSRMAPVLHLVNQIAAAVAQKDPDKLIETLAYQWSRKPPRTMRPLPNVVIRLCTIECSFGQPLETSANPADVAFREDLVAWSKICDRLWIWNYNTSFIHFLLPFPNHHVRAANLRLFARHGVRGVFEQDCYNTAGSELAPLDAYVASRLLWDPELDEKELQREVLAAWFGDAAAPVMEYLELLAEQAGEHHVGIWSGPDAPFLSDEFLSAADELWSQAEKSVSDDAERMRRVRTARMSVDYAILERGRTGAGFPFERDQADGRLTPHPLPARRLEPFLAALAESGLTRLNEWNVLDRAAYEAELRSFYRARTLTPRPAQREDDGSEDGAAASRGDERGERSPHRPGLELACFALDEIWREIPEVMDWRPTWVRSVETIDLSHRDRDDGFVWRFRGELRVPETGIHRFVLQCNDGARLEIGGEVVVDYDGIHPTSERIGFIALEAGWHPLTLLYLENRGSQALRLTWDGPGAAAGEIPSTALRHRPASSHDG